MPNSYPLSSERHLPEHYEQRITPFWQQSMIESQFNGVNGAIIKTAYCLHPNARGSIVISPGRTEGYIKYQELIFDLYRLGFSVFIIDHRGQGLSERLIDHPQKGYVADFNDYIVDFKTFYDEVINKKAQGKRFLLGHSMGGTIATLYLQHYPDHFSAATLSAPMFGFNTGKMPTFTVKPLFMMMICWKKITGQLNDYFIGQKDYQAAPFARNALTYSQTRYQHFTEQYQQQPQLQLGGITFAWLATSVKAIDQLFANLYRLKTPLLMLQASDESIVSLDAQQQFYWQMKAQGQCQKVLLNPAKHEVLFEADQQRNKAITAMLDFFALYE